MPFCCIPSLHGQSSDQLFFLDFIFLPSHFVALRFCACAQANFLNDAFLRPMLIDPNERVFGTDDSVIQVCKDYLLYALIEEKSKFAFSDIKNITIRRKKRSGNISAITYKVKGEWTSFQIDDCPDAEMEEIASLLKTRAASFGIAVLEKST